MSGRITDGVVPVDKPAGPTSHDVVDAARRALGISRIGHTGTLDPFASGLLLLCIGGSTRIAEYLTGLDKTYDAVARLGVATTTDDPEGEVLAQAGDDAVQALDAARVGAALADLTGVIDQVPPQYSAKKVGGEAMHRRARRGESVALEARTVEVHEMTLTAWDPPEATLHVRCSSGTYVRALARDLGAALGVGAHLTALRRTSIGGILVEGALDVEALSDPAHVAAARIDPLTALGHLPRIVVDAERGRRLGQGQAVELEDDHRDGTVVVSCEGALLAIGERSDGRLRPRKVFAHG